MVWGRFDETVSAVIYGKKLTFVVAPFFWPNLSYGDSWYGQMGLFV
jgi:hypothetical protein